MTIQLVRFLNIILVAVIFASGHWYCLWYIAAMQLSLEILNRQGIYLRHPYKIYNLVFWAYELVLLERLFPHHLSSILEWLLNCAEHLGFGIVICLKIYIYTAVSGRQRAIPRWKRGVTSFCIFNIIGVLNEVFQNILANRSLLIFIDDSVKDIKMNLLGGAVFLIAVMFRELLLKREQESRPLA